MGAGRGVHEEFLHTTEALYIGSPPRFFWWASPHLASEENNAGILIVEGQEGGWGHIKAKDR